MKNDLLDHGYVRLCSYMQPVPEKRDIYGFDGPPIAQECYYDAKWTPDLEIVRAARTSYDADWRTGEDEGKDNKLIHRLWSHKHTTPFEAMCVTFEVQAPIFVFRQWHRHRTQSYNEVSARYTELPDLFYTPVQSQVREQSKTNKQGRGEELDPMTVGEFIGSLAGTYANGYREYKLALEAGVARELARLHLSVGTYSRMHATANLLNWLRFIDLRADSHAQYEIRVYADAMLGMLRSVCPVAMEAFDRWKWKVVDMYAPKDGSDGLTERTEMQ